MRSVKYLLKSCAWQFRAIIENIRIMILVMSVFCIIVVGCLCWRRQRLERAFFHQFGYVGARPIVLVQYEFVVFQYVDVHFHDVVRARPFPVAAQPFDMFHCLVYVFELMRRVREDEAVEELV